MFSSIASTDRPLCAIFTVIPLGLTRSCFTTLFEIRTRLSHHATGSTSWSTDASFVQQRSVSPAVETIEMDRCWRTSVSYLNEPIIPSRDKCPPRGFHIKGVHLLLAPVDHADRGAVVCIPVCYLYVRTLQSALEGQWTEAFSRLGEGRGTHPMYGKTSCQGPCLRYSWFVWAQWILHLPGRRRCHQPYLSGTKIRYIPCGAYRSIFTVLVQPRTLWLDPHVMYWDSSGWYRTPLKTFGSNRASTRTPLVRSHTMQEPSAEPEMHCSFSRETLRGRQRRVRERLKKRMPVNGGLKWFMVYRCADDRAWLCVRYPEEYWCFFVRDGSRKHYLCVQAGSRVKLEVLIFAKP